MSYVAELFLKDFSLVETEFDTAVLRIILLNHYSLIHFLLIANSLADFRKRVKKQSKFSETS